MSAIIWSAAAGIVLGIVVEIVEARSKLPAGSPLQVGEIIVASLRSGLLVASFSMLLVITQTIAEIKRTIQSAVNPLQAAETHLNDIGTSSIFGVLADGRVKQLIVELERISGSILDLQNQDEVLDAWRRCIELSGRAIRATNVVSPQVWRSAKMGQRAVDLHRGAIARNVDVKRLWILDKIEPAIAQDVRRLADDYAKVGVKNRFTELSTLERLDGYSACRDRLGTNDIVVFDESAVLLSNTSSQNDVLSGRLSASRLEHVDVAGTCFDNWWRSSREKM